ncbi:uncharacterized protein EV420DRAFT_1476361 [Desarmillaria tabescens]|uniref:Uncharacterized protein n=1 Tax=Armillaria tabescens TaxID=1929756 RepID=A0AA39NDL5_ARMTA|nr:uncharacterized protein EV420DRAFT_1476361 [Desarmillaria tabescens]KAK0463670.1 hypothetical protein EV420DRAFT_1476361 [Desarmillaria tabescens]
MLSLVPSLTFNKPVKPFGDQSKDLDQRWLAASNHVSAADIRLLFFKLIYFTPTIRPQGWDQEGISANTCSRTLQSEETVVNSTATWAERRLATEPIGLARPGSLKLTNIAPYKLPCLIASEPITGQPVQILAMLSYNHYEYHYNTYPTAVASDRCVPVSNPLLSHESYYVPNGYVDECGISSSQPVPSVKPNTAFPQQTPFAPSQVQYQAYEYSLTNICS